MEICSSPPKTASWQHNALVPSSKCVVTRRASSQDEAPVRCDLTIPRQQV